MEGGGLILPLHVSIAYHPSRAWRGVLMRSKIFPLRDVKHVSWLGE